MDKQGILSWPNPSPETVLFFSGRVEPPHNSQDDLRDDLSVNSYCRMETDDDRDEVCVCVCGFASVAAWLLDRIGLLIKFGKCRKWYHMWPVIFGRNCSEPTEILDFTT